MTSPLAQPDGRVAVITGAASGFGRELEQRLRDIVRGHVPANRLGSAP